MTLRRESVMAFAHGTDAPPIPTIAGNAMSEPAHDAIPAAQRSVGAREPHIASPQIARSSGGRATVAGRALDAAAVFWFVVVALGQLVFVAYIAGFYGRAALRGDFSAWNAVLPHGYVPGDTFGNVVLGVHLAFAIVITLGGALQLTPAIRRVAPRFHRWSGRIYLFSALLMSVGGLVMGLTRRTVGDVSQHIATDINAVLILTFAALTLRHAMARRFDAHRRWALRLFLAVSGVWFFRVGLMAWLLANQRPVGFDPVTFSGPFLTLLAFAQYLLPLAVLELYFRARASTAAAPRLAMAAGLSLLTLVIAAGIVGASLMMWLPRM